MSKSTMPDAGQSRHAWFQVSRTLLPKRAAPDRIRDFQEIYGSYDAATAQQEASRCLLCPEPSCASGCPVGSRIPEWLLLTAEGQFAEASAVCRSNNNLAEICARVCPQDRLCEGACILNGKAEPVSIGAIEKFLSEYAFERGAQETVSPPPNGMKVAVLGSGPVGLTCADELRRRGYAVTVFEAQPVPGGLLMNGIPAFKLEHRVVERRTELLRRRGVNFRLGCLVGRDVALAQLRQEFDAVFLGFGAQQPRLLTVPGSTLTDVMLALPFIVQNTPEYPADLPRVPVRGRRVVVLGGGETAMDCLRMALRSGASEALCVYRRDEANMPGSRRDYGNAAEEGARFLWQATPVAVIGDGRGHVAAVRCLRTELREPEASGRLRPEPIPGTEFDVPADVLVVAFGFETVPFPKQCALSQVERNEQGAVVVDGRMMTNLPGVFAGGDLVRGPSLVVHAVRDARHAAAQIHRYLYCKTVEELEPDQTDHLGPETN